MGRKKIDPRTSTIFVNNVSNVSNVSNVWIDGPLIKSNQIFILLCKNT